MQWQIGHIAFDQDTNLLRGPEGETLLEPKTGALLSFFIEHQGRDVSRDELMEHVWHGNIVSENAINRVVVRLRKALGDDDKVKRFIVTVPKVGYRFIAQAEILCQAETRVHTQQAKQPRPILLAMLALPIIAGLWLQSKEEAPIPSGANVSPLVRLTDEQFHGAVSHDETKFVYSHARNGNWLIYKTEKDNQTPILISPASGKAGSAAWSPDDSKIAYQYMYEGTCEFRIHNMAQASAANDQIVYECAGNTTDLVFSQDGNRLYFTEQENQFSPHVVFELDLMSGSKRRLSQPRAIGKGNYNIDRHPMTDTLLLLSAETAGSTSAFKLSIEDRSFEKIYEFDYSVDYAVWGHDEDTIVHMGEHPSYELVETDISANTNTVLVSDSRRITEPKRINNGKDYLFRSFLYNRDIAQNGETDADLNSSVRDYLPAYNHTETKLAFISKRAGYSQVWIKDLNSDDLKAITVSDKGRKYYDLKWSFDDTLIAAATDAGILLINTETGIVIQSLKNPVTPYGVGWSSENTLHFSHYEQGTWQAYEFDPIADEITALDENIAFLLTNGKKLYHFDHQMKLFDKAGKQIRTTGCAAPIVRFTLSYQLQGDTIFCLADGQDHIIQFNKEEITQRIQLPDTSGTYYSPSRNGVAVSVLTSANSDIMRTNFAH